MVRCIGIILLMGCAAAAMHAQAPQEQDSVGKAPAAERGATGQTAAGQSTAGQTAAAEPAKTQYPLDSFTDFSALMVGSRMEIGEGTATAHIYRSGNLMRMEGPEGHGYFVTDLSTGQTFGISATGCFQDPHPYFRVSPFLAAAQPGTKVERVADGKETLDGHSCQIEDITVSSKRLANPFKMKFWEADDLQGFPIKIEVLTPGGKSAIIHYKNVVLGPQDPTLFIHPKSCESMAQPKTPQLPPAGKKPAAKPQ